MKLNEGKIIINNKEIYYGMDSEGFNNLFSTEISSYVNGDIERHNFKSPQILDVLLLWVRIIFKNRIISSIELKNADPRLKNSYDNWSDDKVGLKRKSHDEWLINNLGQPHEKMPLSLKYSYAWGEVLSYYDPKGGDVGIVISYNKDK